MRTEAAPILPPTFTPEVRWLAMIEAVKLRARRQSLEHGCSIEKASGGRASSVSIRAENERKLLEARRPRSLRLAENVSEFIALLKIQLYSAPSGRLILRQSPPRYQRQKSDIGADSHGKKSAATR
jgi:hypothetical protein